jgi:hypothetical protein
VELPPGQIYSLTRYRIALCQPQTVALIWGARNRDGEALAWRGVADCEPVYVVPAFLGQTTGIRFFHWHFYCVAPGTKTISRVTCPSENGEPETGVSAPVLGSRVNPATCWVPMLTYTNLPPGSTAIDDGWAFAPSGIGVPVTGVRLPAESIM